MISKEITINNKVIRNRLVIQPMEGCDADRGGISELCERRYLRFAESGAGIIWFEAVSVMEEGKANRNQLCLTKENKDGYKKLIAKVKEKSKSLFGFEPIIIIQLTHSGRQAKPTKRPEPIVAYRSEFLEKGKEDYTYTIASDEYCDKLPNYYADSAKLALDVGFDGVDVKCCHGYLLAEFMSAYHRKGKYGGTFDNRSRLYFNCVDAVKKVIGDKILTTRINATDCYPAPNGYGIGNDGSIDLTECKKILDILVRNGVEMVNVSLGNPYLIPHINRPFANAPESMEKGLARIKGIMEQLKGTKVALVVSGLTATSNDCIEYAQSLLDADVCDFVGFGRMAFAYPTFYADYLKNGKIDKAKCCLMCAKCTELMRNDCVSGCPIRDGEVYMPLYKKYVLKK